MTRHRLPNRRLAVTDCLRWPPEGGRRVHVSIGLDPESGAVREVFLRGGSQVGSERDLLLDDIAVIVSLLLQHGLRPADIRAHLGGRPSDEPPSVVAAVLDLVEAMGSAA